MGKKRYPVEVPEERWEAWKSTLPRSGSLNDHINRLIQEEIEEAEATA